MRTFHESSRRLTIAAVWLFLAGRADSAAAGVLQRVATGYTPFSGATSIDNTDRVFGLNNSDINRDIVASVGSANTSYNAFASAGRFGEVGLLADAANLELGARLSSSVLVVSDEFINDFDRPESAIARFVIDGGRLQNFFSYDSEIRFSITLGGENVGHSNPITDPFALESLGDTVVSDVPAGTAHGGFDEFASVTDHTARRALTRFSANLNLGASFDPQTGTIDIPLSFQTLNLGTLNPGDRLLVAYQAMIEIDQNGLSEGFHGQFSDPFTLSGMPNPILGMDITLEAVPEPGSIPLFIIGVVAVVACAIWPSRLSHSCRRT